MCHPTIYVLYKYINKPRCTQHVHEEGAAKLPRHRASVTRMGEGLWLCPPEQWGNLFPFSPSKADPCLALGCPEQVVGSRAGAPGLGGQRLCQEMGGALSIPLLHLPTQDEHYSWAETGGAVQGKAKPVGWGWRGRNCGGPWWGGGQHQPAVSPALAPPFPVFRAHSQPDPPPTALSASRACTRFPRAVPQHFTETPLNKWRAVFKHSTVIINSPHIPP